MKTRSLLYSLMIAGVLAITSFVLYPTGSPGGKTGSPGDGGSTCTDCHAGSANTVSGWITTNIPVSGYVPGQTYTITASATHSGAQKYGFELTAEDLAANKKGTIIITDAAQTKKVNSNSAVTHTSGGTTPAGGGKTWSFDWTAPASGTGTVRFYGAFNAANGDGNNTGDVIYLSSASVFEATTGITDNVAGSVPVKVFPNPFADFIEVSAGTLENPVSSFRISSMDGRTVYSENEMITGNQEVRIDAAGFPKGVYVLSAHFSNGQKASYKLVKN